MKKSIVVGKADPDVLKDARVARFQSPEFREALIEGMKQAKEMALAKKTTSTPQRAKNSAAA